MFGIMNNKKNNTKFELIFSFSDEVLSDFCEICHNYMIHGPDEKKINNFANTNSILPKNVEISCESLISFLLDSKRSEFSENNFIDYLQTYGFNEKQSRIIYTFFDKYEYISSIVKHTNKFNLRFRELEWRLETKVASRMLHSQSNPKIIIKLHLDSERINDYKDRIVNTNVSSTSKQAILFSVDLTNLSHLINVLEDALHESKTHRMRNFVKAF